MKRNLLTYLITGMFVLIGPAVQAAAEPATPTNTDVSQESAAGLVFMSPDEYLLRLGRPTEAAARVADVTRPARLIAAAGLLQQQQYHWSTIEWEENDLRGLNTPVRLGNAELGWLHFAVPHNMRSRSAIHAAFQTHKPDVELGAHLEYVAYVVDSRLRVNATVRVVVQAATRTDDLRYATSDGKNIGVITAFCVGYAMCPDWVNEVPYLAG